MDTPIREDGSCYVSQVQQEVLVTLSGVELLTSNFFMTGGTTLAVFYLHHRTSEDLDFFSTHFRDLGTIDTALKRIFKNELSLVQSSRNFFSYLIRGIKVDIVFDPLSSAEKRPTATLESGKKILIDSLDNIASNKLSAVVSRSEVKDLVDLYFIGHLVWKEAKKNVFSACYESARKKEALFDDPATAAFQMEELFHQVVCEKDRSLPSMKKEIDWQSFEEDISSYIDMVYRMEKW